MCDALGDPTFSEVAFRMTIRRLVPILQGSMPAPMPLGVALPRTTLIIAFVGRIEGCMIVMLKVTSQSVTPRLLLISVRESLSHTRGSRKVM